MKISLKILIFVLISIIITASWKENSSENFYIYGNITDYEFNLQKKSILDVNTNEITYYENLEDLFHDLELLSYQQSTLALQDSTYVLLSGDSAWVVNYSDFFGRTILFEYNKMDIDKFQSLNSEDTLHEQTYLYYYKSDI